MKETAKLQNLKEWAPQDWKSNLSSGWGAAKAESQTKNAIASFNSDGPRLVIMLSLHMSLCERCWKIQVTFGYKWSDHSLDSKMWRKKWQNLRGRQEYNDRLLQLVKRFPTRWDDRLMLYSHENKWNTKLSKLHYFSTPGVVRENNTLLEGLQKRIYPRGRGLTRLALHSFLSTWIIMWSHGAGAQIKHIYISKNYYWKEHSNRLKTDMINRVHVINKV